MVIVKIRCLRCSSEFPIQVDVGDPGVAVCPTCGARYRRSPPGETLSGRRAATIKGPAVGAAAHSSGISAPVRATTPLPAAAVAAALEDASQQTFQAGSLVAGRYQVRRFLARGGMGEVYEAEDQTLNVVVALKTLRPLAADDPGARERLKREIQLARRVTHENVCRIFDVGYHQAGEHQISFLTMELLRGETLAARLRRSGRMASAAALPILRQVAAALGAAHKAEVIHRDFKSENVFLVDDPTEESGVRAVVADFGIARATVEDGSRLTGTGVIGTPAYMAPEQLEGGEIGPATDIYAFGLVAYEMVTGRLPFLGDTAIATAVKRLTTAPEPPRQFVPELEERWEAVILRCLERQPADRFPSASAAVLALDNPEWLRPTLTPALTPLAPPARSAAAAAAFGRRPRERSKRWLLAALALALGLVAITTVLRVRGRQEAAQLIAGPVVARRVVAVLGFTNSTGRPDAAWLSTALAEMLTTELGSAKSLRVMPGELVARARVELGLASSAELDASARAKLRGLLGADYFVLGGYTALGAGAGGQVRLDLRLQEAQAGEVLTTYGEDGTEAQLFDIVRRAGAVVRERLGAKADTESGFWSSARWTPEATRLYAQGIAHLRAFEPRAAREVLERAVAADPESSLAHAALADAWGALGYQELARSEAARAFELAAKLPTEEKLEIEGRYRDRTGEAARAAEIYAELFQAHPDDLEVGLRLAAALATAGRGQEALTTVEQLRKLPAPAAEDPRIALAEAMSAGTLSDFGRQRTAAAAAATAAAAKGAQLLVARARLAESSAQRNLGDLAAAETTGRAAAAMFASAGDRAGEADALWVVGTTRFDRGDLPGAKALYDQALAVYREVGDQAGTARVLNSAAVAARQEGDLAGARAQYETVLAICREIADQGGVAASLGNLGTVALQEGHLEGARQQFEESLALRRQLPDQAGLASALANMGVVLRRLGALAEARKHLEESLALRRQSGQKIASAASLCGLGRVVLDLGDLALARGSLAEALTLAREGGSKSVEALALAATGEVAVVSGDLSAARVALEQSLTLRGAIGERLTAAESRLLLANVLLEEGQVSEALAALRAARAEFVQLGATDMELLAAVLEVRVLTVQDETVAARAVAETARVLAERSQSPPARWAMRIARAELDGELAAGRSSARADLALVSRQAQAAGFVGLSWEARLLAAEMAGAAGRQELTAVAREAEAAGFLLLAGKARRAE